MYDAHRVGTMKLKPFYERLMDDMAAAYFESLTGVKASTLAPVGTYRSLGAPQSKYMFDNDPETYYHSGEGQRTDHFVGADMGIVREVREIRIIQGRNSVDDVDYFDHTILEYSADGETWTALTEPLQGVYEIEWRGEPIMARYVGIRKLESAKRNWLAIRSFDINPVTKAEYGVDNNPFTALVTNGKASFAVKEGATKATLLMGPVSEGARVKTLDNEGNTLSDEEVSKSILHLDCTGAANIELSGVALVYECLFK